MQEKMRELIEGKKFQELHLMLEDENSADIAQMFADINDDDMILIYRLLSKDKAVDTFAYLEPEMQERLIHAMTDIELKVVVSNLFMDDTVDLIEEMPATVVKRIIKQADPTQRKMINELLNYPEETAGSVMTTEFVDLKKGMTTLEAFERIRKTGVNKETIYTCYVLDESRRLQGIVTVKELLLASKEMTVENIMETNLITAHTLDDQEETVKKINKYDLLAIPVVDKENRMVGIITIDDAIDVLQDENTEDFEIMAAMTPTEDTYFRTSVFQHAKNRIVWLMALMFSSALTGVMTMKYEAAFLAVPLLVSFIPMLTDTGGNCGSQSSTLVIRGMAIDEIKKKDFLKVLWKEFRVGAFVGIMLAIANGVRIIITYKDVKIAAAVGLTIIVVVLMSKLLGCILPMLAVRLRIDPAMMAAPLITTVVDICALLVYFNIAIKILGL